MHFLLKSWLFQNIVFVKLSNRSHHNSGSRIPIDLIFFLKAHLLIVLHASILYFHVYIKECPRARICAFYCFKIMPSFARARIFAHLTCWYSKRKICQHVDLGITKNMQKFPCQSEFMSLSYSENRNAVFFFVFCSYSAQFCAFWPKIFSTPRFSHMADLINPPKKI